MGTEDDTGEESAKDTPAPTLGDSGKKALDAERKARRDAETKTKDLEARLREIEDKDKPEITRLTEENAQLKARNTASELTAARFRVALDKKLTAAQAKRLVGETEDELSADADELLVDLGAKPKEDEPADPAEPDRPQSKPVEDLKPANGDPGAQPEETDPAKLASRVGRGY